VFSLTDYVSTMQASLFPWLEAVVEEPLTDKLRKFVFTLEILNVERFVVGPFAQHMGRKEIDRRSLARAFVAKAVYDLPTTELLLEMLHANTVLRRFCGFAYQRNIPSAATFSRAFAQFAETELGDRVHEALVIKHAGKKVVMHVSRDSTAVEARETPAKKPKPVKKERRKPGRPKKGEEVPPPKPSRLDTQLTQTAEAALADLPRVCDVGCKKDAKGFTHGWKGWKAHIDWADGGFPLNVVTTSASLHDSQVAIPMTQITARRASSLYDLMDSAYDAPQISAVSLLVGHVPLIDANRRRGEEPIPWDPDRIRRYNERSNAERGNSRLKDEFGLRHLRVRGHAKAHLHIMFAVIALAADALRLIGTG
jgi:hypothetical protein